MANENGANIQQMNYLVDVAARSIDNKVMCHENRTRIVDLEARVTRLEGAMLKVLVAAAAGGGLAGWIARLVG